MTILGKLAVVLVLTLASNGAAKDFQGITTVVCPAEDYRDNPCETEFQPSFRCLVGCDYEAFFESVGSMFDDAETGENVTIPVVCECFELTNCPESCEEVDPTDPSLITDSLVEFTGPALVRCPILDYIAEGCEPDISACTEADECNTDLGEFDWTNFGLRSIAVPLNCACVTALCPASCESEALESTNSYKGPGIVTCPEEDYDDKPCLPLPRLFEDCERSECGALAFLDALDINRTVDGNVNLRLPCDCWEASNCPDTCTFTEGLPEVNLVTFQGPAVVRCPFRDYFSHGCDVDTSACTDEDECEARFDFDLSNFDFTMIAVPLNCECVNATCPDTCVREELEPSNSYRGPGVLTCPEEDFDDKPCWPFPRIFSDCDDSDCQVWDFLRVAANRTDDGNVVLPIPCDCWEASNCPETCTFDNETVPFAFDTVNFTGPGVATCPLDSFLLSPCLPSISASDNECEECFSFRSFFESSEVGYVNIPLACDCIELVGCHTDCTFEATSDPINVTAGESYSGQTGKLSCPTEDFERQPCYPVVTDIGSCLDDDSCYPGVFLPERSLGESVDIPVPCDCMELRNCPKSCEFSAELAPPPPSSPTDSLTPAPVSPGALATPAPGNPGVPNPGNSEPPTDEPRSFAVSKSLGLLLLMVCWVVF